MPDRIRKIQVRLAIPENGSILVASATDHAKIKMTTVRIAVARFESICWTPTLASTAVSPAKKAESNAHKNQFILSPHALRCVAGSELSGAGFTGCGKRASLLLSFRAKRGISVSFRGAKSKRDSSLRSE